MNLEYLGRVVFNSGGLLYPDSVVGTDSHTTMIDGLGVAGWGVGGIEAEAAMLGQVINGIFFFTVLLFAVFTRGFHGGHEISRLATSERVFFFLHNHT